MAGGQSKRPIKCCQPGLRFAADPRVRDDTAVSGERTDVDRASDHIKRRRRRELEPLEASSIQVARSGLAATAGRASTVTGWRRRARLPAGRRQLTLTRSGAPIPVCVQLEYLSTYYTHSGGGRMEKKEGLNQ